MNDLLKQVAELHRLIKLSRESYKKKLSEIDDQRANLFYKAAQLQEETPAIDEVYRQLDLLDNEEFSCYLKFRSFLSKTDEQIDRTIKSIVQRRFESLGPILPYLSSDSLG
jgi:hypothetical protein